LNLKRIDFVLKIVLDHRSPISQIPNEILLRLFTYYLNPYDLFNSCIRVNQRWKNIIQDKTIWKIVNPINWAKSKHFISFHLSSKLICFLDQWNSNIPLEEITTDEDDKISLVRGHFFLMEINFVYL